MAYAFIAKLERLDLWSDHVFVFQERSSIASSKGMLAVETEGMHYYFTGTLVVVEGQPPENNNCGIKTIW